MTEAPYFENHGRRERWPWALYHRALDRRVARIVRARGRGAKVLVVGCGLDPEVRGAEDATYWGCDLDARAVEACARARPAQAARLRVCPSPYELPDFGIPFDLVVAKEVIEHLSDPARWMAALATALAPGGEIVLTTPNYGSFSTLALLERTVLEWIARRDGYSRAHIHPSRFDARRLRALPTPRELALVSVDVTWTGWALVGHWRRAR